MKRYAYGLTDPDLRLVSFPDEQVLDPIVNWDSRQLEFSVTGVFIDSVPKQRLGLSHLTIAGWERLVLRSYDHVSKAWRSSNRIVEDFPAGAYEFEAADEELTIRGFGRNSGAWNELVVFGAKVTVVVELVE